MHSIQGRFIECRNPTRDGPNINYSYRGVGATYSGGHRKYTNHLPPVKTKGTYFPEVVYVYTCGRLTSVRMYGIKL